MSNKTYEITVDVDGEDDLVYVNGDSFHVDEKGNLYIRTYKETEQTGGNEHVAVFVSGYWLSVRVDSDEES